MNANTERTTAPPAASPRSSARRLFRGLLIAAIGLTLAWFAAGSYAEKRLERAVAAYPEPDALIFTSHIPKPLPEGSRNGVDYMHAAILLVDGGNGLRRSTGRPIVDGRVDQEITKLADRFRALDDRNERPDAEDLALARQLTERHALAFTVLDQGFAEAGSARFDADYSVIPFSIEIPNLVSHLRLASLLRARAETAAAAGNHAAAWQGARDLFRLSAWIRESMNTLIHALVARAVSQQGVALAQSLLAGGPSDAGARAAVLEAARRNSPRQIFSQVFAAEQSAAYATILDPRLPETPTNSFYQMPAVLGRWRPWLQLNAAAYLEYEAVARLACERPAIETGPMPPRPAAWLSVAALLVYDCLDGARKRDQWLVALDQLELGLALEDWRDRNGGAYPETLGELGELARRPDPFARGGEPYRYRREGKGYRLYSLGANQADDQGRQVSQAKGGIDLQQGDLVWRVERP